MYFYEEFKKVLYGIIYGKICRSSLHQKISRYFKYRILKRRNFVRNMNEPRLAISFFAFSKQTVASFLLKYSLPSFCLIFRHAPNQYSTDIPTNILSSSCLIFSNLLHIIVLASCPIIDKLPLMILPKIWNTFQNDNIKIYITDLTSNVNKILIC